MIHRNAFFPLNNKSCSLCLGHDCGSGISQIHMSGCGLESFQNRCRSWHMLCQLCFIKTKVRPAMLSLFLLVNTRQCNCHPLSLITSWDQGKSMMSQSHVEIHQNCFMWRNKESYSLNCNILTIYNVLTFLLFQELSFSLWLISGQERWKVYLR